MRRALLFICLIFCLPMSAQTLRSYFANRRGLSELQKKSYFPAYRQFLSGLETDPLNINLHLNIALSSELNEDFEKAEAGYRGILGLLPKDSPERFAPLFNLGGVLARQKKIKEALAAYQQALDLQPDSKEVKTNIELLWQQGGGGGSGDSQEDKKNDKDQKGQQSQDSKDQKDQNKNQNQREEQKQKRPQPKPFDSKELSPQDVKKILDEIKNQEQAIRAQEYERGAKDSPKGKDW